MLTLLPILTQVIAIVVWALFLIMVGAPLAAGPSCGREALGSKPEPAVPVPPVAGRGRPTRLAARVGRAAGARSYPHRTAAAVAAARPISRGRSR